MEIYLTRTLFKKSGKQRIRCYVDGKLKRIFPEAATLELNEMQLLISQPLPIPYVCTGHSVNVRIKFTNYEKKQEVTVNLTCHIESNDENGFVGSMHDSEGRRPMPVSHDVECIPGSPLTDEQKRRIARFKSRACGSILTGKPAFR
jgi:hypothetical protein